MFIDELEIYEPMRQSRHIQRLCPPRASAEIFKGWSPFAFGGGLKNGGFADEWANYLARLFEPDYMGSAEYENGKLPEVFRFFRRELDKSSTGITAWTIDDGGRIVYCIAPTPYVVEVTRRVLRWSRANPSFREIEDAPGLAAALDEFSLNVPKRFIGWIEIDNGFMFFTDRELYAEICKIFAVNAVVEFTGAVTKKEM